MERTELFIVFFTFQESGVDEVLRRTAGRGGVLGAMCAIAAGAGPEGAGETDVAKRDVFCHGWGCG